MELYYYTDHAARYGVAGHRLRRPYVQSVQEMQGFYVACIEEIAWRKEFITTEHLMQLGHELSMTSYGSYILDLTKET